MYQQEQTEASQSRTRTTRTLTETSPTSGWVNPIQPEDVENWWAFIEPEIHRFLKFSPEFSTEFVKHSLLECEMQAWVIMDPGVKGVCITQIIDYPTLKSCLVFGIAGKDLDTWIGFLSVVEAWAREIGCVQIRYHGRPGLRIEDFKHTHNVMVKAL